MPHYGALVNKLVLQTITVLIISISLFPTLVSNQIKLRNIKSSLHKAMGKKLILKTYYKKNHQIIV